MEVKAQKGITLIALIITIVVLLILSTIVIKSIVNDGILEHAENGANVYNEATNNEQDELEKYEQLLNKYTDLGEENNDDNDDWGMRIHAFLIKT